ncbi:DNA-3-methyladenine glycosylase I [Reichenbachiella agariperforans]|uniref:DNA-3-methyladenine glycosylase I n=1 Tax=Reichenbachiella agariperforans TaxID=156994 RepID=A0A1M6P1A7_REIAG|nr:DNA-3-methyladenine glycosylase I [Reichenbachiella agariperforans]MBU2914712.1 DNA-3-methyladenine glycosylase I [Reichenbachiella agariperforans]SHK01721.1 DNA-3-methyladenine glycosylase I [Reichenbachiella agariperforans]
MCKNRCQWARDSFEAYERYHDEEWGVPVYDDKVHFEFLILEGAQAGLSWSTIIKKREGYRQAFADFDVQKVATYTDEKMEELRSFEGIVRNKLKIKSVVTNARLFIEIQKEFGSFSQYIWSFVKGEVIVGNWKQMSEVPATTPESDALSKDLKKRGFKFVGSTIMYAHMQATGLVNDHTVDCYRYHELLKG